jgi:DNA-binding transcriptional regulator YhcF (GntR family)
MNQIKKILETDWLPSEKLIAIAVLENCSKTIDDLAMNCSLHRRSIFRVLKEMEEKEILYISREAGRNNVYEVNL